MLPTVSPHRSPLEVAEQGADQLPDAALIGGHHALQAHHEVPAVLGVEHHQLVLPRGHAHSCHLGQRQREREREDTQLNTQINKYTEKHKHTGGKKGRNVCKVIYHITICTVDKHKYSSYTDRDAYQVI